MSNLISILSGKPITPEEAAGFILVNRAKFWHHLCIGYGVISMEKGAVCNRCGSTELLKKQVI